MSTPGELVAVVASTLGVPQATIVVHDRNLVAADLRSKHGRGRGAARVTARDAANLLTAILGSPQVRDSADTVRRYSRTAPLRSRETGGRGTFAKLTGLAAEHSFVDALEALFELAATAASLPPSIDIGAVNPGTMGDIRLSGLAEGGVMQVRYALPVTNTRLRTSRPSGDLEEYRRVTGRTIHAVAKVL